MDWAGRGTSASCLSRVSSDIECSKGGNEAAKRGLLTGSSGLSQPGDPCFYEPGTQCTHMSSSEQSVLPPYTSTTSSPTLSSRSTPAEKSRSPKEDSQIGQNQIKVDKVEVLILRLGKATEREDKSSKSRQKNQRCTWSHS